jgi:hypothetical protein
MSLMLDTIGALAQNLATFRFVPAAFSNYIAKKLDITGSVAKG